MTPVVMGEWKGVGPGVILTAAKRATHYSRAAVGEGDCQPPAEISS